MFDRVNHASNPFATPRGTRCLLKNVASLTKVITDPLNPRVCFRCSKLARGLKSDLDKHDLNGSFYYDPRTS
jgi:hypothetical protein